MPNHNCVEKKTKVLFHMREAWFGLTCASAVLISTDITSQLRPWSPVAAFNCSSSCSLLCRVFALMNSTYGSMSANRSNCYSLDIVTVTVNSNLEAGIYSPVSLVLSTTSEEAGHLPHLSCRLTVWITGCTAGKSTDATLVSSTGSGFTEPPSPKTTPHSSSPTELSLSLFFLF